MKGDFSRDSFNHALHYSRVLIQQGRVQLDSDFNEQTSILLHYLRSLAVDVIGPHGGSASVPADAHQNFEIWIEPTASLAELKDLTISPGRYYVDGILCESETGFVDGREVPMSYTRQPFYPLVGAEKPAKPAWPDLPFIVYLRVWERLITAVEDPHIREVALGGPDTAARAQVVWQVRVAPWVQTPDKDITSQNIVETLSWKRLVGAVNDAPRGRLRAIARKPEQDDTGPCILSPESRYRGLENQLYRVEIHNAGLVGDKATFKWSRENGSVVFPIRDYEGGDTVLLEHLGHDERYGLHVDDWVEFVDDGHELRGEVTNLRQVEKIDPVEMIVTLRAVPGAPSVLLDLARHPLLRRWDHQGDPRQSGRDMLNGAMLVVENISSNESEGWLALEDGVYIQFQKGGNYRTGDYWLIPARTATGDLDWPRENSKPLPLLPRGIQYHYAPLAYLKAEGTPLHVSDLRRIITPIAKQVP